VVLVGAVVEVLVEVLVLDVLLVELGWAAGGLPAGFGT
jgi:hypothetical protein